MTATATLRLLLNSVSSQRVHSIAVLTDKTIIAIVEHLGADPALRCYQSLNNGTSWTQISTLPHTEQQTFVTNLLCFPGNIVCFGHANGFDTVAIFRSTDGGANWTTAQTFTMEIFEPGAFLEVLRGATMLRSRGVYAANLQTDGIDAPGALLTTTNSGASWALTRPTFSSDLENIFRCLCAGDSGAAFLGGWPQRNASDPGGQLLHAHLSTDYGATWANSSALPLVTNSTQTIINDYAVLTDSLIVACAEPRYTTTPPTAPALYNSDDSGSTWNLVAASDVADWTSPSQQVTCANVKRLTRDSALLQLADTSANITVPWRISLNAGQTYNLIPSATFPSLNSRLTGAGHAIVAPGGRILAPARWYTGSQFPAAIYSIELT